VVALAGSLAALVLGSAGDIVKECSSPWASEMAARLALRRLAPLLLLLWQRTPSAAAWQPPWAVPEMDFTQCATDVHWVGQNYMNMKGLVMDDVTFRYCPSRLPEIWPNLNNSKVTSLRLFRSWNEAWPEERQDTVWDSLVSYVKNNGVKVLMGTPVTCDAQADDRDWKWTKALMQRLGPTHVMGFAVGNELELLWGQKGIAKDCILELWDKGGLWKTFQQRVAEVDEIGFGSLAITSVFTSGIIYSGDKFLPFVNIPGQAMVNDFLKNATRKYARRFVFAVNIYPYFDPTLTIDPPHHTCESAIKIATCFKTGCLANKALIEVRQKMVALTHRPDDRLWIGEIGWSSPKADALSTAMAKCPTFSSVESLTLFYRNFLEWDLSVGAPGVLDPDHAFYFTMRDAQNFGNQEYFGLLKSCNNAECKIHSADFVPPEMLRRYSWMNFFLQLLGSTLVLTGLFCATWASATAACARRKGDRDSSEESDSSSESSR